MGILGMFDSDPQLTAAKAKYKYAQRVGSDIIVKENGELITLSSAAGGAEGAATDGRIGDATKLRVPGGALTTPDFMDFMDSGKKRV